jgi:hypothetical protein
MPQTPASAGVKLNQMYIAFAFAVAPVTFGSAIVCVLAGKHIISYWWLALTLGWAIVPLAVLARARRQAKRGQARSRASRIQGNFERLPRA